jgi:transcriptional regulator GlxA family with amidase domain
MCKVKIWVYEGCLASAVSGPLDIFTTANAIWSAQHQNKAGPLFTCRVESMDGAPVQTPSGMVLNVDGIIEEDAEDDVLLLPSIYLGQGVPYFLRSLERFKPLHPVMRKFHQRGTLLASNCSASFLLADAQLLTGGHATTNWLLARAFRERYSDIELRLNEILTEYDRVMCSGTATTFMNLALHLVERFAGQDIATSCAKILLIDANHVSQMPYMILTQQDNQAHADPLVLRAQE